LNGAIPDGLLVCHRCDNPPCCNPAHWFLGTNADNAADKAAKGRVVCNPRRGVDNPGAKLTEDQVIEIRWRHAAGEASQARLGREFGMAQTTIGDIVRGEKYANVRMRS